MLAAQTLHAVGYAMGLNFDADIEAETGTAAPARVRNRPLPRMPEARRGGQLR